MSDILIDISASDDWSKDEITLVEKILLFSFKALSNKKLTEISVRLTGDEEIKLLNKQYRDKNSSTNVLSFPSLNDSIHPEANEMLGDIVISKDTVLREAKNSKKSFE